MKPDTKSISVNGMDMAKWTWTRRAFLHVSAMGVIGLGGQFAAPSIASARVLPPGRLKLVNVWSHERLQVTYRDKRGVYDRAALDEVNYLLRCHYSGAVGAIDVRVLEYVNLVQAVLGKQGEVHVISGFRSPAYNAMLVRSGKRAAKHSLHMQGQAIDLLIPGVPPKTLRQAALGLRYGGVGSYRRSRFVHLDSGPFRFW